MDMMHLEIECQSITFKAKVVRSLMLRLSPDGVIKNEDEL